MDFYDVTHVVTRNFYKLYFKVSVKGKENIPKEGPAIICSNHKSYFDPLAATVLTSKRRVHFMAKKELFENRFANWLFRNMEAFPVDRDGNDLKSIRSALKFLKDGDVVGIFPEGTRTKKMDLSKSKVGIIMIAIKAKVPIVPIYIDSEYNFRGPLNITIREPIHYDEYYGKKLSSEVYEELSKDVLRKIYGVEE